MANGLGYEALPKKRLNFELLTNPFLLLERGQKLKIMNTEMTIKEAISQGYDYCGKHANEWQSLTPIEDLKDIDIADGDLYLADKEGSTFKFGKDQIAELLSDVIGDNESQETGRDTEDIYDAIKAIDFSETEKLINDALSKHRSYKLTDIKLVSKKALEKEEK